MNVQLDIIHNGIIHNNIFISDNAICAKHNKQNINQNNNTYNINHNNNTYNINQTNNIYNINIEKSKNPFSISNILHGSNLTTYYG